MSDLRRAYRLLTTSFHDGVLRKAGEIVMLLESEVASHHELVEPERPRRARAAEPPAEEAKAEKPKEEIKPRGKASE